MSGLLLWVAIYGLDINEIQGRLGLIQWNWLIAALILKSLTLWLREFRLWLSLTRPRPPLKITFVVGFIAGGLHTLLPGRGGDLAAIPMLKRGTGISAAEATHAVGMTAALEALAFGALTCIALGMTAGAWGEDMTHLLNATWQSAMTFSFILMAIFVVGAVLATKLRPGEHVESKGMFAFVKALIFQYRQSLKDRRELMANGILALLEVWLMVLSFAWGFHALGMEIVSPWTIAAIIMGGSAFAAVALPPSYGAGPAAVSLFVLSAVGVDRHVALAYSAIYWVISQGPLLAFAGPSIWLYKENQKQTL